MALMSTSATDQGAKFYPPEKRRIFWEQFPSKTVRVELKDGKNDVIFEMDLEAPAHWSDNSLRVIASRYVHPLDESSVFRMIDRVCVTIAKAGLELGYFSDLENNNRKSRYARAQEFYESLYRMVLEQKAVWNSPVWFNVGLYDDPQVWACLIAELTDEMHGPTGIGALWETEWRTYKGGSGIGTNYGSLRAEGEYLSMKKGQSTGPMSFIRTSDAIAGTIKSGGKNRRAAKMNVMDADHPDIVEFVRSKAWAEDVAHVLIDAGYDVGMNGEHSYLIPYQNANHSVRLDGVNFFDALDKGEDWPLQWRSDNLEPNYIPASELWNEIAQAAWKSADPGLQFDDHIQSWHTTPSYGPIRASNPCLVGGTLVDTVEGRIKIRDLARMHSEGKELPLVWAFDLKTRMPVLRKIVRAWRTKKTKNLVRVTTDKGLKFLVTPDHRFLVGGGKGSANKPDVYIQAKDLKPGQSLRKVARGINKKRSMRRYIDTREGTKINSRYIWEQINGPIPDGYEIDHIDGDPTNDRPDNLQMLQEYEHGVKDSTGENNSRFIQVAESIILEAWEKAEEKYGEVIPSRWNRYIRDNDLVGTIPLARGDGRIRGKSWDEFADEVGDLRNDKVVKIELVEKSEPVSVYDLEVEGTHNFAISYGSEDDNPHSVIVHNCSEYLSNDDTVCNLASLNHLAFWEEKDGAPVFNEEAYIYAVRLMITSMDILVSISSYPRESIRKNVTELRQLGLGFANFGALLMWLGIPYDSKAGRSLGAALQSLMQASAAERSAEIAEQMGPHGAWEKDGNRHLQIMERHSHEALNWRMNDEEVFESLNWDAAEVISDIWNKSESNWDEALEKISEFGLRNAQLTVIAPTGTISFLMGCETQGIEPFYSFSAIKTLVGGGELDLSESSVVGAGLKRLKMFDKNENTNIEHWINGHPVFQTAVGPENVMRPEAHVLMMGAVQTSVSGAISKTANMPHDATVEEVAGIYRLAHQVGCKAIALYRDGSKFTQPLNVKKNVTEPPRDEIQVQNVNLNPTIDHTVPVRNSMPWTRKSTTHKFRIGSQSFYLTVGFYENGKPGEIFVTAGSEGTFPSGTMNAFAKAVSIGLQYGIPLNTFAEAFVGKAIFEPNGPVMSDNQDPNLKFSDSVVDYIFKWLTLDSKTGAEGTISWGSVSSGSDTVKINPGTFQVQGAIEDNENQPRIEKEICPLCGRWEMVPNGTCKVCLNCGETTGCG